MTIGKTYSGESRKMRSWIIYWGFTIDFVVSYIRQVEAERVRDWIQVPRYFPMMDSLSMRSGTSSFCRCHGEL